MVSFVRRKDIERKTFVTRIWEEGTDREIAVHHYLIRYVTKVDRKRRFGKVQGIQRYQFYLFPSCILILALEHRLNL